MMKQLIILSILCVEILSDSIDFQEGLDEHNYYRLLHSAPPLTLDDNLNDVAKNWADNIASLGQLQHSANGYGENLYYACGSDPTQILKAATDDWYSEEKYYDYGNPVFSKNTGHFTQVVWVSTLRVGFGVAYDDNNCLYVVANYDPPGNFEGEFYKNVLPY